MKVFYEKTPPKSRTGKSQSGTCFTLRWAAIAQGAQMFRKNWLKGTAANKMQNYEPKFKAVEVSDSGVTFYFEDGEDQTYGN